MTDSLQKRILALFLVLAPVLLSAQNSLTYTTNNGAIIITGYVGSSSEVTNVVIPDTINAYPVVSIGTYAFYSCTSLTNVTIGHGVTNIGYGAFWDCDSLINADIGTNVLNIDDYAFHSCDSLASVTLPSGVTNIGAGAFSESPVLAGLIIPDSVVSIGEAAFRYCHSLASVTVSGNVTNLGRDAFAACAGMTNITVLNENPNYSSLAGVLFNKHQSTLIQCPGGFSGSYTIPEGVTSISDLAFQRCASLTNVTMANSIAQLGDYLFTGCLGLTSVTIGNGIKNITEGAFSYCSNLVNVTIPDNVTHIENAAFAYCTSLRSATIGNGVTNLGAGVFQICTSLTNIAVTAGNPAYSSGNGVLFDKPQTTLIRFPAGLSGSYAIPSSVTNIGDHAFSYCAGLTNVTIPAGVRSISDGAFVHCSGLASATIPNSVKSISSAAFLACTGLKTVTVGNGVTNLNSSAFAGCTTLTNVTFLGNAPTLGGNVFSSVPGKVYYYYGATGWSVTYGGLPAVMLYWPPQIAANNVGVQSGIFRFVITGVSNQIIVVEASTNLVIWQPVWTNTLTSTSTNFTDLQWANYPARFYRAR
jgi:hypothetical protein